jgi:hypothetical protein
MFDRLQCEIDVELRPVEVAWMRHHDVDKPPDGRLAEPEWVPGLTI